MSLNNATFHLRQSLIRSCLEFRNDYFWTTHFLLSHSLRKPSLETLSRPQIPCLF